MISRSRDFKSPASAIPPRGHTFWGDGGPSPSATNPGIASMRAVRLPKGGSAAVRTAGPYLWIIWLGLCPIRLSLQISDLPLWRSLRVPREQKVRPERLGRTALSGAAILGERQVAPLGVPELHRRPVSLLDVRIEPPGAGVVRLCSRLQRLVPRSRSTSFRQD